MLYFSIPFQIFLLQFTNQTFNFVLTNYLGQQQKKKLCVNPLRLVNITDF